jgi:hypothetical protein
MASDKIEHGLWEVYERELPEVASFLVEVGVYLGDGMRLLREKYPTARIAGVDILPRPEGLEESFEYHQLDQRDPRVAEVCAGADVVIDDCSHNPVFTRQTFDLVWPVLRPGGCYFIEDWTPWMLPEMSKVIDGIEADGVLTERFIITETDSAVAKFTKAN